MNLILVEHSERTADGTAVLRGERARHVADVLRAGPGDRIRVGLVDGPAGEAVVVQASADAVELRDLPAGDPPPRARIDLLLALPRPKVLKRLWAQLAALGVDRILLTNAARVERNYFDTHVLDEAFHRPLLLEGLQQARDTRLPRVSLHRRFRPFIEDELDGLTDAAKRLVADPSATVNVHTALTAAVPERVLLAVGPEGGWVPFELDLLRARGFTAVGLGPRTLRTDTACVALLALVTDALYG